MNINNNVQVLSPKGLVAWQALDPLSKQFLHCMISSGDSMPLEPFRHMKPFVQGWPHIPLEREMLQKWKDNLHKLKICKQNKINKPAETRKPEPLND